MINRLRALGTAAVSSLIAGCLLAGAAVYAQGASGEGLNSPAASASAAGQGHTAPLMAQRKMMPDMQSAEKRLDELVAKMNASRGADKIDHIAAVVNELVAQHKSMHAGMTSMPAGMMDRMKTDPQSKEGAAPTRPDNPGTDHKEHHP